MLVLPVWNNIYVNFIYETQTQFFYQSENLSTVVTVIFI